MIEENCVNCKFWCGDTEEDFAQPCLRFPPQVYGLPDGRKNSGWPDTAHDDWCGEWKARDEVP